MRSQCRKGSIPLHQGSVGNRVLRIIGGEVEVLRAICGIPVLYGHARADEWHGEIAVIESRSYRATACAIMPTSDDEIVPTIRLKFGE